MITPAHALALFLALCVTGIATACVLPEGRQSTAALCGAALALTAGLAVTCFVKVFAMGFLGVARAGPAATATEGRWPASGSMALLAAACVLLGVLPTYVIPVLDRAVEPMAHASAARALVPPFLTVPAGGGDGVSPAFLAEFHDLGAQVGRGVLPGRGLVVLHQGGEANPVVFAMSTSYMTVALATLLVLAVAAHFRTAIRREYTEVHVVDRLVLQPVVVAIRRLAGLLRRMHIGHVNAYAAYVLLTALLVLVVGRGHDMLLALASGLGVPVR